MKPEPERFYSLNEQCPGLGSICEGLCRWDATRQGYVCGKKSS